MATFFCGHGLCGNDIDTEWGLWVDVGLSINEKFYGLLR
jgi:hypothetical protein